MLGKNDGAMSIGKSSTLLAIDFVFGGDTYIKSDGVRQEGDHTIYFTFKFNGKEHPSPEILEVQIIYLWMRNWPHRKCLYKG